MAFKIGEKAAAKLEAMQLGAQVRRWRWRIRLVFRKMIADWGESDMSKRAAYVLLGMIAVGTWVGVAEYFHLSLYTLVIGSVAGAAVCLLVLLLLPRWRRRRCRREYCALLDNDQGQIAGKARYRNRRVVHFCDGSVAGEAGSRMKAFPSFDDYRAFVDRR